MQSRLNLPSSAKYTEGGRKPNKWVSWTSATGRPGQRSDPDNGCSQFSIETGELDEFRDELYVYKTCGSFENRPPPMIIETYIDASGLSSSQSLVLIDDNGKRWDVLEALNSSVSSDDGPGRRHAQKRKAEVVLERWRIELKCLPDVEQHEFGPSLPTIYKRSIVFFRSLFLTTRMMPCWKYSQQTLAKGIHPALQVRCRILSAEPEYDGFDPLRVPLHNGGDTVTEYVFTDLEVPVGRFYSSVTYRNDCNFRVDDAESLLSSRFMGIDANFFKPSIPPRREHGRGRSDSCAEPGSLPAHRQDRDAREPQQTYGSLSTFHGEGALGTSPITALRSLRPFEPDSPTESASPSASSEQADPPHSLPIRGAAAARPPLRPFEATTRRPSVSFQPFKAGSLSGSPRIPDTDAPPSPQSLTRPGLSGPSRTGNRSSLTAGMPASLRGPAAATPQDIPSVTGSPRPPSRYSSSFTHRRARPSLGGQSRADDDQASSGKQSLSSSAQPGSGLLTEAGGAASSGSFATDDDNISEFLKALDNRKTLKSFEPGRKGESLASKRTAAQLSKFHMMRESNNALTDSMTSSIHMQRSSTSSSRQLANVPSMVNPASMSVSSSPGKPLSPHTPHTPAIPSRLSENSIIDYQAEGHQPARRQARNPAGVPTQEEEGAEVDDDDADDDDDDDDEEGGGADAQQQGGRTVTGTTGAAGTGTGTGATAAIDIPLSPRLLHHGNGADRRASSVAQQHRSLAGEVDAYVGQRSASVEAASKDREVPTLSTLLAYRHGGGGAGSAGGTTGAGGAGSIGRGQGSSRLGEASSSSPAAEGGGNGSGGQQGVGSADGSTAAAANSGGRAGPAGADRPSYRSSFAGSSTRGALYAAVRGARLGSFSSATGGGRYAGSVEGPDEEPLLFAMSELERDSRRSLEEGRGNGGGVNGGSGGEDKAYGPRGVLRKGW